MSKKHKYYYHTGPNLYIMIILILIVLQWFRVSSPMVPGPGVEGNLTCNGGLFIITMFMLVACSCGREVYPEKHHCHHH